MADCGFNLSLPYIDSLSEVRLALDASKGTGIKIIAKCAELDSIPETTVRELMQHPSLAGYFFKDEPHIGMYGELAERVKRVRAVDDTKLLYLNLFPTYAGPALLDTDDYNEYISRFISEVGTGMVSYDHYSITTDTLGHTALNPDYYKTSKSYRPRPDVAGVPFWAFALSTAHYSFPAGHASTYAFRCSAILLTAHRACSTSHTGSSGPWNLEDVPITKCRTARHIVVDRTRHEPRDTSLDSHIPRC